MGFFTIFGSKRSLSNISWILPSIVKVFWTNPFITQGCYKWHAQLRSWYWLLGIDYQSKSHRGNLLYSHQVMKRCFNHLISLTLYCFCVDANGKVQVKSKYKYLTLLIGPILKTYMSYHAVKNPFYNHHHDFKLCISKFTVDTKWSFAIFSLE